MQNATKLLLTNTINTGNIPWVPAMLGSSLLAWWSADRIDLITLSGNQVTSWRDIVGGYDALQAVATSQPLYSATSFNGAPGITSDAVDDELTVTPVPASIPIGAAASEIWAIASQNVTGATAGPRLLAGYGGAATFRRSIGRTPVVGVNRVESRAGTGTNEVVNIDTVADFSSRHVVRAKFAVTAGMIALNVDDGAESASAVGLAGTTADRLRMFASPSLAATAFYGGMLRDLLITLPLTNPQAAALTAWALPRRML